MEADGGKEGFCFLFLACLPRPKISRTGAMKLPSVAAVFACSVSHLLCIIWCCIKLPGKIGLKGVKHAAQWVSCGSEKKVYASYSSFSDNESDALPSKVNEWDDSSGSSRYWMRHSTDESKRSAAS